MVLLDGRSEVRGCTYSGVRGAPASACRGKLTLYVCTTKSLSDFTIILPYVLSTNRYRWGFKDGWKCRGWCAKGPCCVFTTILIGVSAVSQFRLQSFQPEIISESCMQHVCVVDHAAYSAIF